jgi:hypothetical protein
MSPSNQSNFRVIYSRTRAVDRPKDGTGREKTLPENGGLNG